MISVLAIWLLFVAAGCAVLLPLYARLLSSLQRHHPREFEALGRPTLFMVSPARSIKLQRFIYTGARQSGIHPEVARLARLVGLLTPLFVALVLVSFYYGYLSTIDALFVGGAAREVPGTD